MSVDMSEEKDEIEMGMGRSGEGRVVGVVGEGQGGKVWGVEGWG